MRVKYVNFQFVDILGRTREKLVPLSIYDKYLESGLNFDGSSVIGYTKINNSDLTLNVDKNYIYHLPQNKKIIFCEANYECDSRKILKNAINEFKKLNKDVKIGAELEFFIFNKNKNKIITNQLDNKSYLDTLSIKLTKFFEKVLVILESLKFNVECVHHECGANQYELDFKFDSPLEIADKIIIIKNILKDVAEKSGLYVSFMPKPFKKQAGSGMHINLSIFSNGKNLFNDENDNFSLIARQFSSGILKHIKSITAFANPLINSYKRLGSYEAPSKIGWSENDRSVLIRIPKAYNENKRIELRSPDNCCNPYLTFASIIYSGLDEVLNNSTKYFDNVPKGRIPNSLNESINFLKKDKFLNDYIGKQTINAYTKVKEKEIEDFNTEITNWEIKKYL